MPAELRVLMIALVLAAPAFRPAVTTTGAGADVQTPATRVRFIDPPGASLPANRLQMVIVFSAPMAPGPGLPHLTLLDAIGHEVHDAIRPADRPWNEPRTRYTFAFDPMRVRPGSPATAPVSYTLLVDRDWRDARGLPLAVPYLRLFRVGPPAAPATARGCKPACAPERRSAAGLASTGAAAPRGAVQTTPSNLTLALPPVDSGSLETPRICS